MVADIEVAGGSGGRRRRAVATDDEVDSKEFIGVTDDAFREREVEVDTDDGEDEAKGKPEVGDDGVEDCWAFH